MLIIIEFVKRAIAIVKQSAFNDFQDKISNYYTNIIGYAPSVYHSLIGNGVGELTLWIWLIKKYFQINNNSLAMEFNPIEWRIIV